MSDMSPAKKAWSTGGMVFAAAMMLMIGLFQFFQGLAAVLKGGFFIAGENYAFSIDTSAWGWIHMIMGVLLVIAGYFLFTGSDWARAIAIFLAVLSAVTQFFFLPYYPFWALLIIALDVFVIWAVATAPRDYSDDMSDTTTAPMSDTTTTPTSGTTTTPTEM